MQLPGNQDQSSSSHGETDDNRRRMGHAVSSLMDLYANDGSPRISERVTIQRPRQSPRLLHSSESNLMSLELQRHFSVSGADLDLSLRDSSLREQNSTSSTPMGMRLKRTRTKSYNFDESLVGSPNPDYDEMETPRASAVTTTIRKREHNRAASGLKRMERLRTPKNFFTKSGEEGKGNNDDSVLQEKNDALHSSPPLPTAMSSSNSMQDNVEFEIRKISPSSCMDQAKQQRSYEPLSAALDIRKQQQRRLSQDTNQNVALATRGNIVIDYGNEPDGLRRSPNRRNIGNGEGGGAIDEDNIEVLARRLTKLRQKQKKSRGDWSAGLGEPWRKEGKSILILIMLGVLGSIVDAAIDIVIIRLNRLSNIIVHSVSGSSRFVECMLFTLYLVLGTTIAVALTALVAPDVSGSGLPLMKWLIGIDDVPSKLAERFTVSSGIVKVVGLSLGAGVGLNIGREGPFVHISGILAYQLMSCFTWFHDILHNESLLRQVLVSSTSLGIGSTFAATIGGVLFTIEITSTYYLVAQYFKGFVAGVAGAVAVTTLATIIDGDRDGKSPFVETNFTEDSFHIWELPIFAFLGVICGFFGPLYGQSKLLALHYCRRIGLWSKRNDPDFRWPFILRSVGVGVLVAFTSGFLTFWPGYFNELQPFDALNDLFLVGDLPDYWTDGIGGVRVALLISFVVRWVTAVLSTSIVLPAGDFILTTVCGASLGRLCGVLIMQKNPGTYAFIGGAALSAAATQSVSSAVIVMELAGAFVLKLPTLLAVVVSVGVSRKLGKNIYDCIVEANELSSLQGLKVPDSATTQVAYSMMETGIPVIPSIVTHRQILDVLDKSTRRPYVPVVSRIEDMIFLGVVDRRDLLKLVHQKGRNNVHFMSHIQSHNNPEVKNSMLELNQPTRTITGAISDIWGSIMPSRRSALPEIHNPTNSDSKTRMSRVTLRALQDVDWEETDLEHTILKQVLDEEIDLIHENQEGNVYIDANAWSVPELLHATELYVVLGGQLRGVVTRDSFLECVLAHQNQPVLRRIHTFGSSLHQDPDIL